MSFPSRLKELREAAKLTQGELAGKSGIPKASISNLEQDRRKPTWETIQKLAGALGCSCEAFQEPTADASPVKPEAKPSPKKKPKSGKN
jgi:transcriptional regulator with XRE-family HTH domain